MANSRPLDHGWPSSPARAKAVPSAWRAKKPVARRTSAQRAPVGDWRHRALAVFKGGRPAAQIASPVRARCWAASVPATPWEWHGYGRSAGLR
jgi:hypothetical protein